MTGLGTPHVTYEIVEEHVAVVTLRRPEKRNAITAAMAAALGLAAQRSENDPLVRVVVLTGSGTAFCAGADLEEVAAGHASDLRTTEGGFAGLADLSRSKPWIAAVDGPAFAGGFEIALSCDIIVAGVNAEFALPEVKRGLVATGGGVYRLPKALPRHVALDMIATGDSISAERAYQLGLVSQLVRPEELLRVAIAKARAIAGNSPLAVRESLAIARIAGSSSEAELQVVAAAVRERILSSAHAREGTRAFLERRAPEWPD